MYYRYDGELQQNYRPTFNHDNINHNDRIVDVNKNNSNDDFQYIQMLIDQMADFIRNDIIIHLNNDVIQLNNEIILSNNDVILLNNDIILKNNEIIIGNDKILLKIT